MMSSILKFLRITLFLVLYFFLCMVVVTAMLQGWPVGGQMLFAFGVPVILVWWQEKRRSRRIAARWSAAERVNAASPQEAPPASPAFDDKLIERESIQEVEPSRSTSEPRGNRYQKLSNAEIIAAAIKAAPVLTSAEKRKEAVREIRVASGTHAAVRTAQPTSTRNADISRTPKTGWIAAGETVSIAGREIGGMVYVGTPPLLNTHGHRDKCRAYIDPSLSVAGLGADQSGHEMPYWPGYSDISPKCRATYLDWLASGRSNTTYNPGYMFLYL